MNARIPKCTSDSHEDCQSVALCYGNDDVLRCYGAHATRAGGDAANPGWASKRFNTADTCCAAKEILMIGRVKSFDF